MLALFSDASVIALALGFEGALARAEAAEGVIPEAMAEIIATASANLVLVPEELAEAAAHAGTLAIPLVKSLRDTVPEDVASFVHFGATSQDVADTVLMCQVKRAISLLAADHGRIVKALGVLAERHAATPAIGRTLLQDALPIGLGLRFAQWLAGIDNAWHRLANESEKNAKIAFGGPAGTRAGFDGKGAAVAKRLAEALNLAVGVPWHGRRTGTAAIGAALGILIGALAKMARDISLLAQNAIGEVREPTIAGRGGSSAMAHKRNPTGCQIALAAAHRAPGLVAAMLASLPAEEERGLGGWQAEGPVLADLFLLASGSIAVMADVAEGLDINEAAIAHNLSAARLGDDIGESQTIVEAILSFHRKE
ncbi:lyase family protein [Beijerinckia mobilis]|uniref:lyase family protein n=1 Tax=Beijerinckia mobilis TaxID=231434 RepID=UPI000A914F2E|nr:lyase family protein [Beijerinckia mobilis]